MYHSGLYAIRDLGALVIDLTIYFVSKTDNDHTLIVSDAVIDSKVIMGEKNMEVSTIVHSSFWAQTRFYNDKNAFHCQNCLGWIWLFEDYEMEFVRSKGFWNCVYIKTRILMHHYLNWTSNTLIIKFLPIILVLIMFHYLVYVSVIF